jgi:(p)ppGpp synthase/HD superfamily hydrolase
MTMKLDEVFESKWLKASDLTNGPAKATITEVGQTTFKDKTTQQERKQLQLTFREFQKPFGCNITNAKKIAGILNSRDTDDWIGKTIVLYVAEVESFGETVEAIRVRAMKQQVPQQSSKPKIMVDLEESENPAEGMDASVLDDDDSIPF